MQQADQTSTRGGAGASSGKSDAFSARGNVIDLNVLRSATHNIEAINSDGEAVTSLLRIAMQLTEDIRDGTRINTRQSAEDLWQLLLVTMGCHRHGQIEMERDIATLHAFGASAAA